MRKVALLNSGSTLLELTIVPYANRDKKTVFWYEKKCSNLLSRVSCYFMYTKATLDDYVASCKRTVKKTYPEAEI